MKTGPLKNVFRSTIDTYISNAAEISQPINIHLRQVIKTACPAIEENIKWNAPSFELNGSLICSIMGFKGHVNFMLTQDKFTAASAKYVGGK